jgi:nitroreductase
MKLDLASVDHVLTTTRSVRKRLDFERPVPAELVQECIDISLQSPTGSNAQGWRVMVVTDAAKRKAIADLYRKGFQMYQDAGLAPQHQPGDVRAEQMPRVIDSALYLAEHLHEAPVMVLYCIEGRMENGPMIMQASLYGSVLPAAWSFMLAARSRGLGSAWTTIHLFYEKETAELLGIPPEFTQAALLPVAYFKGDDFKPANRVDPRALTYWNTWGQTRR